MLYATAIKYQVRGDDQNIQYIKAWFGSTKLYFATMLVLKSDINNEYLLLTHENLEIKKEVQQKNVYFYLEACGMIID